jgi:predicted SprT family Zn-dependent metalloprotease
LPFDLARRLQFNLGDVARMNPEDQPLRPLPYHVELRDYLKSQERELWNWFSSARAREDYTANLRLELLKATYRLDREAHPELHQAVDEVKARLQLDIPVTLYQAQHSAQSNASLYFIPGEGHVVFSGPLFTLLNAAEIKSVLGHELAHYHLWGRENGEFHIADRLIHAVAHDPRAAASHEQSARRYQLYTEIFADRGSLAVTGDVQPVIAGLVKLETGMTQVSAASYLKQAEEIFAHGSIATRELSHPETFIRARALALWHAQGDDAIAPIRDMIEGVAGLDELDLIGQVRLAGATRRLLQYFLQPKWFQTPPVLGHAKLFFSDFQPAAMRDPSLLDGWKASDAKWREYLSYVLLDFVSADPDLDEMPLAAALELSRELELETPFEKLATRELKLKARDVKRLKESAAGLLARAEVSRD